MTSPDEFLLKSHSREILTKAIEAILIDVYHNTATSWREIWSYEPDSRWAVTLIVDE